MDLLSSIRKEGSRGGVDFKWSDVSTSQHRENYLGHSLMAPVGRWQKNRDLSWYAKADSDTKVLNKDGTEETAEEKSIRERKEEIRRIKEAEEDALAKALGLPVADRGNGMGTGANNIDVGEMKRVIKETEAGDDEIEEVGRGRGFGDFVGKVGIEGTERDRGLDINVAQGGLIENVNGAANATQPGRKEKRERSRSRSREGRHRKHRHRERSRDGRDRRRHIDDDERHRERKDRSRSPHRRQRRHRSRSEDRGRGRRDERYNGTTDRSRNPYIQERRHRSRSDERHRGDRQDQDRKRGRNSGARRSRSPAHHARERRRDSDRERRR
jgi:hypothetical protein